MRNRILGTIGMLGAPFLCIDLIFHSGQANGSDYSHTSLGGFFSLLYISAWMCSIIGLRQLHAAGKNKFGKNLLLLLLFTLTLANCWNVYEMIDPGANTPLYGMLDMFWPISNLVMLLAGITIVAARQLMGWKRYVPLMVGLWFPLSVSLLLLMGKTSAVMYVSGFYSAISWIILGYVIRSSEPQKFSFPATDNSSATTAITTIDAAPAGN
jgi:hypothetical protein